MAEQDTTREGVSQNQATDRAAGGEGGEGPPSYSDTRHSGRRVISDIVAKRNRDLQEEMGEGGEEQLTGEDAGQGAGDRTAADDSQDGTGQDTETDTGDSDQRDSTRQTSGDRQAGQGQEAPSDGGEQQGQPASEPQPGETKWDDQKGGYVTYTKVDGKGQWLPTSEVVRGYQMASTAQSRIREANRRLQEAQAKEQQLQQMSSQPATQQGAGQPGQQQTAGPQDQPIGAPSQQQRQENASPDDWAVQAAQALQFGDAQEAAEAIQQIAQNQGRAQGDGTTPDPNQIAQQVTQQVREQQAYEHALQTFGTEYPDVINDQYLTRVAADAVHDLRRSHLANIGYDEQQVQNADLGTIQQAFKHEQARGTVPTDVQLFRSAGDQVRSWMNNLTGSQQPGGQQQGGQGQPQQGQQPTGEGDQSLQQKQQRKRQTGGAPVRGTNQAAPQQEQGPRLEYGSTYKDAVARLKQARGQSQ